MSDDTPNPWPAWFEAQMARLWDLRFPPSSLRGLWEGLQGVPEVVIDAAVTWALQTRAVFPTAAELREDADVAYRPPHSPLNVTHDLAEPVTLGTLPTGQPIVARRVMEYWCEDCYDTGWRPVEDRTVERCACWDDGESVVVQRRAAQARYATGRSK